MKRTALALAALVSLAIPASASAWPTWGNLENSDCAFAAAANWELLHGGTNATEDEILREFVDAGGETNDGTSGETLERYWATHGIGGRRVKVFGVAPDHLRRIVRREGAVIAELAVIPGQQWRRIAGTPTPIDTATHVVDRPGGVHYLVVRYINKVGPVVLTWGELAQMTWWQWREDALLLYPAV